MTRLRHGACLTAPSFRPFRVEPEDGLAAPRINLSRDLGFALDRMLADQMTAYPDDWSDADKREMAERHLFNPSRGANQ